MKTAAAHQGSSPRSGRVPAKHSQWHPAALEPMLPRQTLPGPPSDAKAMIPMKMLKRLSGPRLAIAVHTPPADSTGGRSDERRGGDDPPGPCFTLNTEWRGRNLPAAEFAAPPVSSPSSNQDIGTVADVTKPRADRIAQDIQATMAAARNRRPTAARCESSSQCIAASKTAKPVTIQSSVPQPELRRAKAGPAVGWRRQGSKGENKASRQSNG